MDDEPTMDAASPPPRDEPDPGEPPGLRAQFGATVDAVKRLLGAHVDLAKAELGEIVDEVKRMVALAGLALGALVMGGLLVVIGGLLFLGDWLLGSMGWGVVLGLGLFIDVAVIALLLALDVTARRVGTALLGAIVIGLAVGAVMAFDLTHLGWTALADSVASNYDPNTRAVLLAAGVSAAVIGVLFAISAVWRGAGGAFGKLLGGAVVGALLGLLTVISIPPTVGAALGVLVALVAWPVLAAIGILRTGVDGEAIGQKFRPDQTIETTKETIEWVRARTPLAPKS